MAGGTLAAHRRLMAAFVFWWALFALAASAAADLGASEKDEPEAVLRATTIWSVERARSGDRIGLAVVMQIAPGFHINANEAQIDPQPAFSPFPTQIAILETSPGVVPETPLFPAAHTIEADFAPNPLKVFDGKIPVIIPMKVPPAFSEESLQIKIALKYQACDATTCLFPQEITLTAKLPAATDSKPPAAVAPELFAGMHPAVQSVPDDFTFSLLGLSMTWPAAGAGLSLILALAVVGGLLLNFTPCVLPLIPIKIMSLSNAAQSRLRCLLLGMATFAGLMTFWLLLGLVIALSSEFTAVSQLFQIPFFTISVGIVIAVLAVSMCGGFSIPLPQFIYRWNPKQETFTGAFGIGLLSAILSTPCTAPVMGTMAAWAATQNPGLTLLIFAAIGTGMALPYLVLSAAPGLVMRIPRSGPMGALIKETMGLFLMAAAIYFLGAGLSALTVVPPDPPSRAYWWAVMGFIAAGGLWASYRLVAVTRRRLVKGVCILVGLSVLAASVWGGWRFTDDGPIEWVYYTEERCQQALEEDRVVVMVFTAAWCLNCKALEHSVLRSRTVVELLDQEDVVAMKVDITANNPAGLARLKSTGYLTIPLIVVLSPDGREVMKRSFYTANDLVEAIASARLSQ